MATSKEPKALVKYDNKLNMIALKGMTQVENDVFFALLYKLKNQGTKEIQLSFTELKRLIGFESQNNEYILKSITNIAEKIAKSIIRYETDETIKFFALFQILEVPKQGECYIKAKISEPFEFMLNNLQHKFTAFEIAEFSGLNSKYSQTLYRLLKQYKTTGLMTMEWDKFCDIMDIPATYKNKMINIEQRILKPAVKELQEPQTLFNQKSQPFRKLSYKKTKTKGQGNKITGIEFRFLPETTDQKEQEQARKDLHYLATRDKQEQMLKNFKQMQQREKEQQDEIRINPLTGEEVDSLNGYLSRYLRIYNPKIDAVDTLKIQKITRKNGQIEVSLYNVDDGYGTYMTFSSEKHFINTFEKYGN